MMISIQFSMSVFCMAAPVEIAGACNGQEFYYRARHGRWGIWSDIFARMNSEPWIAGGKTEEDASLEFAYARIIEHIIRPATNQPWNSDDV